MADKKDRELLRETIRELLKEAEAAEHRRLRGLLEALADRMDFTKPVKDLDGKLPDVHLLHATQANLMFIADAKDAAHQTIGDSAEQITGYLASIGKRIAAAKDTHAVFVIATNTEKAARDWEAGMPRLAKDAGVTIEGPDFIVRDVKSYFVAAIAL